MTPIRIQQKTVPWSHNSMEKKDKEPIEEKIPTRDDEKEEGGVGGDRGKESETVVPKELSEKTIQQITKRLAMHLDLSCPELKLLSPLSPSFVEKTRKKRSPDWNK